jgi:hypothetical protein
MKDKWADKLSVPIPLKRSPTTQPSPYTASPQRRGSLSTARWLMCAIAVGRPRPMGRGLISARCSKNSENDLLDLIGQLRVALFGANDRWISIYALFK